MGLAQFLSRTLVQTISTDSNNVELPIATDWRVLAFTGLAAVATCLLFGIVPALRGTRAQPVEAIKAGGRGLSQAPARTTVHRAIVVAQLAISLVLLVGALLFVRSLYNLATFDPGFRLHHDCVRRLSAAEGTPRTTRSVAAPGAGVDPIDSRSG